MDNTPPKAPVGLQTLKTFDPRAVLVRLLGPEPTKGRIRTVGVQLASLIIRPAPFTTGYVYNILSGKQNIGAPLAQALRGVWVAQNGGHPISGAFDPIDVYAVAGTVEPASLILARSRRCPTCLIPFVPRVPNQRYCNHVCKRRRPKAPPPPQGSSAAGMESTEGDGALLSEGENDGE
jgi:hypothetical protein